MDSIERQGKADKATGGPCGRAGSCDGRVRMPSYIEDETGRLMDD